MPSFLTPPSVPANPQVSFELTKPGFLKLFNGFCKVQEVEPPSPHEALRGGGLVGQATATGG